MPSHATENDDDGAAEPAAANGRVPAAAHEHGTMQPAPGLDPVEVGYSSSDDGVGASRQPNGAVAPRPDGMPPRRATTALHEPHHLDGAHSKLDRMKDRARSEKNEARRNWEDKRSRFKVSMHLGA